MGKEQVVVMFVVMVVVAAALCPALSGGMVIEQASEAAAKTAEEGLGNIARQAIHKANKILNGSSKFEAVPRLPVRPKVPFEGKKYDISYDRTTTHTVAK